jgi:hypothetical protein
MTSVRRSILEVLFPVLQAPIIVEDATAGTGPNKEEGIEDEKAKNNASAPPDEEAEQSGPQTANHHNDGGESALLDRMEGGKNDDASDNRNVFSIVENNNEKNKLCSICLERLGTGMYQLPCLQCIRRIHTLLTGLNAVAPCSLTIPRPFRYPVVDPHGLRPHLPPRLLADVDCQFGTQEPFLSVVPVHAAVQCGIIRFALDRSPGPQQQRTYSDR